MSRPIQMRLLIPMLGKNKFFVVRLTYAIKRLALLVLHRLLSASGNNERLSGATPPRD